VEDRHLTPTEFDLLVDGEEGLGVAPLKAHVQQCVTCRTELETQQLLISRIEQLPHFSPAPLFSYRVMKNVQVFEPWYVTAANTAQRLVPKTRSGRVLAAGLGTVIATSLTAGTLWLGSRLDAVAFLAGLTVSQVRGVGSDAVNGFVSSTLGPAGIPTGDAGIVIVASAFVASVAIAAVGLRALAAVSRRRRM
jgi:hypothetical protein